MKLADELITKARQALFAGQTLEADLYHRAATQVAQDEALIARLKDKQETPGKDAQFRAAVEVAYQRFLNAPESSDSTQEFVDGIGDALRKDTP